MIDSLEQDLSKLVIDHWALVFELYQRADELKRKVIDQSRDEFRQRESFIELEKLGVSLKGSGLWYVAFEHQNKLLSYVQVEVPKGTPRLGVYVRTAFTGSGVSYVEVKNSLSEDLRNRFSSIYDASAGSTRTLARTIVMDSYDLNDLISQTVDEVERQVEVGEALFEIMKAKMGRVEPT